MTETGAVSTDKAVISVLVERFGERVILQPAVRRNFSNGEGLPCDTLPDAVFGPHSTDEVAEAVEICARFRLPVVAYGAGTSLEGQVDSIRGGLTLNLAGMDRIIAVNADDLDVHVQAGVTREALNAHLRDHGLFFPLDPGANATIGGMAATRASGTNAVRYGTMREVTLGLTVVTAQGKVARTGGRARKSSTGYDLTRLYIGSEGTLGIITELHLRVSGIPEQVKAGFAQFPDTSAAIGTVIAILQLGIPIARIEFLDAVQTRACIDYSKLEDLLPLPTLFLELHGSPASVSDQEIQLQALFDQFDCVGTGWAEQQEDRTRLWKARHDAYWAGRALKPGFDSITTDSCVPISRLCDAIAAAQADAAELGFECPIVGHVGDGNFHMMILHQTERRAEADQLAERIARRAIAVGGTASGEHGIGHRRMGLMFDEHGDAVSIMQAVKAALDPLGILNPGKLLPTSPLA